jgi:hypothetical protein
VLAEQFAKQAAPDDESVPVFRKMEAVRPNFLIL